MELSVCEDCQSILVLNVSRVLTEDFLTDETFFKVEKVLTNVVGSEVYHFVLDWLQLLVRLG